MSVASFLQTIWASMTPTAYKNAIDANFAVAKRSIDNFAPNQQVTPNMTVLLDAGHTYDGTTLTEVAAQSTATIATPATGYMRIDRIVINSAGVNSVITGTPVTSAPVAPAITVGDFPVCQVLLDATSAPVTAIVNSMITDERVLAVGYAAQASYAWTALDATNATSVTGSATVTGLVTSGANPKVSAYLSVTQGLTSGVDAKVLFDTTSYDIGGPSISAGVFTPKVAGYYSISWDFWVLTTAAPTAASSSTYFNGATRPQGIASIQGLDINFSGKYDAYFNGTTDSLYISINVTSTGGPTVQNGIAQTNFSAHLIP